MEPSQFVAFLRVNNRSEDSSSGVHNGVKETDGKDRNFDRVITAARANGSGLRGKFRVLQTKSLAVHTDVSPDLVNVAKMAKRSITFEEQLRKSDKKLHKTQRELQVVSSAASKSQHLA